MGMPEGSIDVPIVVHSQPTSPLWIMGMGVSTSLTPLQTARGDDFGEKERYPLQEADPCSPVSYNSPERGTLSRLSL